MALKSINLGHLYIIMKNYQYALFAAFVLSLSACAAAPGLGGGDYGRAQVRGEQSVRLATVMSVRGVRIEGTKSGLGALTGAAVGGLAGHTTGGGRGTDIATVAGAVAGGLVGSAIEESSTKQEGVEVTVQFDSGKLSVITQAADELFKVGDRVMVTSGSGVTRVTKVAAGSALNALPPPPGSAPSDVPPVNSAPPHVTSVPSKPVPPVGSAPSAPPSGNQSFRWYCPVSQGYYPAVPTCTANWIKVVE
jgi:outer membrane lipoprotein SlyB